VSGLPVAPIRAFRQEFAYASYEEIAGPPELSPIEIVRDSDVASPELYGLLVEGTVLPEVQIVLADGALSLTLENALLLEMGGDGTQSDRPLERLVIAYRRVVWTVDEGGPLLEASYDLVTHEGGGLTWGAESYVHPGPGVAAEQGALLFSELTSGVVVPFADGRQVGSARLEALGLVTRAGAPTLAHLGALIQDDVAPSFTARFTALSDQGRPIDRFAYRLAPARVMSVRLETEPDGTLTESLDVMGQTITWSARGPNGQAVKYTWEPRQNR